MMNWTAGVQNFEPFSVPLRLLREILFWRLACQAPKQ
jgi:hypothetical protein